ncbi:MAG: restriction endonuclease subunit S [Chloroflexota bacterium]|nr:restriction endonuclease subunit S [Chloroflexota bacterium]
MDIRPDHLEIVQDILREHLPVEAEVWVFGSRANWTTKDSSDLDLAVEGATNFDHKAMVRLEIAFEESELPYTVDVVDLNAVSKEFKKIVEGQKVPLPSVRFQAQANDGGWKRVTLGDVCTKVGSGATPRGGRDVYLDEGLYTLIRSQNVYNDGFHRDGLAFIGDSHANELQNVEVFEEDVLLNITGDSVARVCQVAPDVLPARVNQHVAIIRPDSDNLDAGYLRYYLASPEMQAMLLSWAGSGGTRNALTKGMIESLEISLPPVSEQRAIAAILGALDDKIELNRRMNQTLEEMARAIFRDWFVDFGPVRAKLEGREPYLPPELWDLFPDRLVDSELGEIPEGWEVKALGEVSNLNPESWSRTNYPVHVEYVDLANTKWGVIGSTQHFAWKGAPSRAKRVLRTGDTIVGTVRPGNGSYSFIGNDGLTGSTGFAVLRPLHPRFRELVYLSATALDNIERLAHRADGAAYPAVRPEIISETEVAIPADESRVLNWFSKTVGPVLDKMESVKAESRALATQRDALLPKLISGESRVADLSSTNQEVLPDV